VSTSDHRPVTACCSDLRPSDRGLAPLLLILALALAMWGLFGIMSRAKVTVAD
jgi:hypothetical protein